MRLTTRAWLAVAFAIVAATGAALLVWSFEANTFTPRIEAYEIADDTRRITVFVCGQTNDSIADQRVRADASTVTVGVRLRRDTNPNLFHHGMSFSSTLTLNSPLGDRIVRDELGNIVRPGTHLCPG